MLKLNLLDVNLSDIKFKISHFPDGQQTVELYNYVHFKNEDIVLINSNFNSFLDLEVIICATQALKEIGFTRIRLFVPYFLGSRSDRKFRVGSVNYLKQVICPIINSQNYEKVCTFDPHSDVIEACINNFKKINNIAFVGWALNFIINNDIKKDDILIVAPDAGSIKKIYEVCYELFLKNMIVASKIRDIISGDILKTEIPKIDNNIKRIVIIDDICDGGRTFVNLAKEIKKQTDKPIYLIVSHGIFSAGFGKLLSVIDEIYTTDSVKIIENEKIKQFKLNNIN